jgi:hypothetical protein
MMARECVTTRYTMRALLTARFSESWVENKDIPAAVAIDEAEFDIKIGYRLLESCRNVRHFGSHIVLLSV